MKMKKILKYGIFLVFLTLIIITLSCRKYNFTNRIQKAWVVEKYYINDIDSTNYFNNQFKNYEIEMSNNNGYVETYLLGGIQSERKEGVWILKENSKVLELNENGTYREFNIEELKINSMILKRSQTGEKFYFIPK